MKFLPIFGLFFCATAILANPIINQKKIDFLKKDLESLRSDSQDNNAIDDLLKRANRIAQMNDRCGSISLNDVLDETCQTFFSVELPQFEQDVAKTTGEIRMGALQLDNSLKNRVKKINACADALQSFFLPYSDAMELKGDIVDLIPTNETGTNFKVSYDFTLNYKKASMKQLNKMANQWVDQCRESVIDKSNGQFVELFSSRVKSINERLKNSSTSAFVLPEFYSTGNSEAATLNFFLKKRNFGGYYMNGQKLFDATPDKKKMVYLQMHITTVMGGNVKLTKGIIAGGYGTRYEDPYCYLCKYNHVGFFEGVNFKGTENFTSETEDIKSGWIWY